MEIRKLTCTIGRTLNLGNYESLRVDATFAAMIEKTEDEVDCWDQLVTHTRRQLKVAIKDAMEDLDADD